jgi:hypothetical protein
VSKDSDQAETAPRKFKLGPLGSQGDSDARPPYPQQGLAGLHRTRFRNRKEKRTRPEIPQDFLSLSPPICFNCAIYDAWQARLAQG